MLIRSVGVEGNAGVVGEEVVATGGYGAASGEVAAGRIGEDAGRDHQRTVAGVRDAPDTSAVGGRVAAKGRVGDVSVPELAMPPTPLRTRPKLAMPPVAELPLSVVSVTSACPSWRCRRALTGAGDAAGAACGRLPLSVVSVTVSVPELAMPPPEPSPPPWPEPPWPCCR